MKKTFSSLKIISMPDDIKIKAFKFSSSDDLKIPGYLVLPSIEDTITQIPCVVIASAGIHGSIFKKGTKNKIDPFHMKWFKMFSDNGIATLFIDKRGSRGYKKEFLTKNELGGKEIDDIIYGIKILKSFPTIDQNRIFGYGVSRVTVTMFWVAIKLKTLQGVILQTGFYDINRQLSKMNKKYTRKLTGQYTLTTFPYRDRSPLFHADKFPKHTRVLLVHSPNDEKTGFRESCDLYKVLRKEHISVKFIKPLDVVHLKKASEPGSKSGDLLIKNILKFIKEV